MSRKHNIDDNGFETFDDCKFFCECVAQYLGREIDTDGRMGLKPNAVYNVYRPKSEISMKEFIDSLHAKPVLDDHHVIGNVEGLESPDRRNTAGVLTDVKLVGNELRGRIDVWSPSLLEKIRKGKRELSLAYSCDFIPRRGVFNGENYDFIQSNIKCGNHLAFVDEARNGHDCRVMDGVFARDERIQLEKPDMDISKLSADEVVEALKGCSDEVKNACRDFLAAKEEVKAEDKDDESKAEDKAKDEKDDAEKDKAEDKDEATESEKKDDKAEDKAKDGCGEDDEKAKDAEVKAISEEEVKDACAKAVDEYKDMTKLAEDCAAVFGNISLDGIRTSKELAIHVCALDSAPKALKDISPDGAVAALRGYLAGRVGSKAVKFAEDSKSKMNFREYMASR